MHNFHIPDYAVRYKCKPSLEDDGDNACPVEKEAHLHLHHHIVKSHVVDDERKCVQ